MSLCTTHYEDNQGLCHNCGIVLNPDSYEAYFGHPPPKEDAGYECPHCGNDCAGECNAPPRNHFDF